MQTSFFILYAVVYDSNKVIQNLSPLLEKPCDFALDAQASCHLCDFGYEADSDTLWTLWTENGQAVVRYSSLNAKQDSLRAVAIRQTSPDPDTTISEISSPWSSVLPSLVQQVVPLDRPAGLFDSMLDELNATYQVQVQGDAARPSTVEAAHQLTFLTRQAAIESFLAHLFHPGRYPIFSIQTALYRYLQTLKGASVATRPDSTLAQQVLDTVAGHVRVEQDGQTGALLEQKYVKQVRLEWLKLLALADEGRREALLPLGLHLTTANRVSIGLRQGTAVVGMTDPVAKLSEAVERDSVAEETISVLTNGGVADTADIRILLQTAKLLSDTLASAKALIAFEAAIDDASTTPLEISILDLATGIYDDLLESHIDDELATTLISALGDLHSREQLLPTLFTAMAALIQTGRPDAHQMQAEVTEHPSGAYGAAECQMAVDLSAAAIKARYALSMQLFALLIFIAGEMLHPDSASWPEGVSEAPLQEETVIRAVSYALVHIRRLSIARWLAEHNTAMTDIDAQQLADAESGNANTLMQRLSDLKMRTSVSRRSGGTAIPQSVLQVLADSRAFGIKHAEQSATASSSFLADLSLVLTDAAFDGEQAAIIAAALQEEGRCSEALLLIEKMPEKNEHAALLHIKASIAAARADVPLAELCFNRVAAAICRPFSSSRLHPIARSPDPILQIQATIALPASSMSSRRLAAKTLLRTTV